MSDIRTKIIGTVGMCGSILQTGTKVEEEENMVERRAMVVPFGF